MLTLLALGERRHPALDAVFIGAPDRTVPITFSKEELKSGWLEVNEALWVGYSSLSPSQWLQRHTNVSEEDFAREAHRNRYAILLGRASHLYFTSDRQYSLSERAARFRKTPLGRLSIRLSEGAECRVYLRERFR